MKQDKKIMDEKINKIGQIAVECLNGREFNKLIVGLIVRDVNDSETKNMEVFYEDPDGQQVYFNELISDESFNDSREEQKYLDLQGLLIDLRDYCVSYGDAWKYMTFVIDKNGDFKIDFEYEPIEVRDWRNINNLK